MATVRLRIGPAGHGRRMTPDEFLDAEEEPSSRIRVGKGSPGSDRMPRGSHAEIARDPYRIRPFSAHREAIEDEEDED